MNSFCMYVKVTMSTKVESSFLGFESLTEQL